MIPTRRRVLASLFAPADPAAARSTLPWEDDPARRLAALELRHRGRLSVAVLDTGSGEGLAFRAFDRFPRGRGFNPLLAARLEAGGSTTAAEIVAVLRGLLPADAVASAAMPAAHALAATGHGERGLRAGLPGWRIGPMTGGGDAEAGHDLAIAWPPGGGAPLLIAAAWHGADTTSDLRDVVLADVAAIAGAWARSG